MTDLIRKCMVSVPSALLLGVNLTWISTQPLSDGAQRTILIKKSASTCWIRYWSPYAEVTFISSGMSRIICNPLSLSIIMTWLTTEFITLSTRNSLFSIVNDLHMFKKVYKKKLNQHCILLYLNRHKNINLTKKIY